MMNCSAHLPRVLTFLVLACAAPLPAGAAEPLLAGIATIDITPPVGYRMSGYFNERFSTGVKDPLQAKALVLRQGDVAAALVFCDLIGVPRRVADRARADAAQATGIPAEHIAVAATHSHTGPLYYEVLRNHFHARAIEQHGADPHEPFDYAAELATQLTTVISQAASAAAPVELAAGFAREERLSFNRRFHMKDGSVQFNPGLKNPNIVRAAGPIDPQVGVIALRRPEAVAPTAALAAFALHLDTLGGTEYSADYPRVVEDELRKSFGADFQFLFGAGTCGDLNHIDVAATTVRKTPEIGAMLAETIGDAMTGNGLDRIAEPRLGAKSTKVSAALQRYSRDEVAAARAKLPLIGGRELPFLDQVKACAICAVDDYHADALPLDVQAFRLSDDAAIVTLPAEVFVEIGLAIKARSPFKTTLVFELTNDCLGYIPTRKAFAEGSYETVNSRIEPGAGEQLVDAALSLLRDLK